MATQQALDQLEQELKNLESIDKQKLFRPNLGDESLQSELEPKLTEVLAKARVALEYAPAVADEHVSAVTREFHAFYQELHAQAERESAVYIQNKEGVLHSLDARFEAMLQYWPPFVTAAIEARGFLEDEGVRKEYDKAIENLQTQAQGTLASIKEESQKILDGAQKVADQIEQRARRTAAHVSVEEAQAQFREAQTHHEKQVKLWAWISVGSGVVFVGFAVLFWFVGFDSQQWQLLYYTALRLALLGVLVAFSAFCLKTLRAHLHMRERNLHRQRVANSIPSFVDSAVNHDQRDLILAQLIDAVATFGNSGLLSARDDLVAPTKLAVDSVMRNINSPTQKS